MALDGISYIFIVMELLFAVHTTINGFMHMLIMWLINEISHRHLL